MLEANSFLPPGIAGTSVNAALWPRHHCTMHDANSTLHCIAGTSVNAALWPRHHCTMRDASSSIASGDSNGRLKKSLCDSNVGETKKTSPNIGMHYQHNNCPVLLSCIIIIAQCYCRVLSNSVEIVDCRVLNDTTSVRAALLLNTACRYFRCINCKVKFESQPYGNGKGFWSDPLMELSPLVASPPE